jgi:Fe-S cluster assembly protein SufD
VGPDGAILAPAEPAGLEVLPLAEAVARHGDGILGRVVGPEHGKFEALTEALWTRGLWVRIPRGVDWERPLRILWEHDPGRPVTLFRSVIEVEGSSRIEILEQHAPASGSEARGIVFGLSEVLVGDGAVLQHAVSQELGAGTTLYLAQRTALGRDVRHGAFLASVGRGSVKADLGSLLRGAGAETELLGVVLGGGRQRLDHHTLHEHLGERTRSNLELRVVLAEAARSAYTGEIRILPQAAHSEAYQENRNVLLGDRARAETIPELEILTDEVRCKHGATVGQVDEEEVYYLTTRGIAPEEARRMILRGFVQGLLDRLPERLRTELAPRVLGRLNGLL